MEPKPEPNASHVVLNCLGISTWTERGTPSVALDVKPTCGGEADFEKTVRCAPWAHAESYEGIHWKDLGPLLNPRKSKHISGQIKISEARVPLLRANGTAFLQKSE